MPIPTVAYGSTGVKIARIGHGLMMMTARPNPVPDETCFAALKAGMDLVGPGEKVLLNSGEFYGIPPNVEANLQLLSRFFDKYPSYTDKCILSVKGGVNMAKHGPDSSPEFLNQSIANIQKHLGTVKHLDHWEPGRLDRSQPFEQTMGVIKSFVDDGKCTYVGMSEVNAKTLRDSVALAPVCSVELEVSPWAYGDEVKEAISTAKELGVSVIAYSPLGRGFLTGNVSPETLGKDDHRRRFPRFADDMMEKNKVIVDKVSELAKKKGITNAQLCLAWVCSLGDHVVPIPGSSSPERTLENFAAANITFTPEEKKEIDAAVESFNSTVSGHRYAEIYQKHLMA